MNIILWITVGILVPTYAMSECVQEGPKRGYWFYNECPMDEDEADPHALAPLPSQQELMAMHPESLRKMIQERLEYAVYRMTPEAVADYYKIIDVSRRKALAFTALTEYVMLKNPELNAKTQNPATAPARNKTKLDREAEYNSYIRQHQSEYALVMFSRESCQYCVVQEATLKQFGLKYNWIYRDIDVDLNPEIAARFSATTTPLTVIIEKNSDKWLPVSVGAESVSEVESGVYRALRFLREEITPTQFITDRFRDGGFFDPSIVQE